MNDGKIVEENASPTSSDPALSTDQCVALAAERIRRPQPNPTGASAKTNNLKVCFQSARGYAPTVGHIKAVRRPQRRVRKSETLGVASIGLGQTTLGLASCV